MAKSNKKRRKQQRKKSKTVQRFDSLQGLSQVHGVTKINGQPTNTKTYSSPGVGGKKSKPTFSSDDAWLSYGNKCRHKSAPYDISNGKNIIVYASSHHTALQHETYPDFGLYADKIWSPVWRNEFIAWQDYGLPLDENLAFEQILNAVELAQSGKRIEVGCIGGHGRTGTILAIMSVILGEDPKVAIQRVKSNYCSHAVETDEQEWLVEAIHCRLNNLTEPEQPESWASFYSSVGPQYTVGRGPNPVVTSVPRPQLADPKAHGNAVMNPMTHKLYSCKSSDHEDAWLQGWKCCPNKPNFCKWWVEDVKKFSNAEEQKEEDLPIDPQGVIEFLDSLSEHFDNQGD